MYSIVKSATCLTLVKPWPGTRNFTRLVSRPNHTLVLMEWKAGTVSSTVTMADSTIKDVIRTCTKKAESEDVGCSSRAYKLRRHSGWMAANVASSREGANEKISWISWGDEGLGSSVRNRAETWPTRVNSMGADIQGGRVCPY